MRRYLTGTNISNSMSGRKFGEDLRSNMTLYLRPEKLFETRKILMELGARIDDIKHYNLQEEDGQRPDQFDGLEQKDLFEMEYVLNAAISILDKFHLESDEKSVGGPTEDNSVVSTLEEFLDSNRWLLETLLETKEKKLEEDVKEIFLELRNDGAEDDIRTLLLEERLERRNEGNGGQVGDIKKLLEEILNKTDLNFYKNPDISKEHASRNLENFRNDYSKKILEFLDNFSREHERITNKYKALLPESCSDNNGKQDIYELQKLSLIIWNFKRDLQELIDKLDRIFKSLLHFRNYGDFDKKGRIPFPFPPHYDI